MLTHARVLEMNITVCKMLQVKLAFLPSAAEAYAALSARIALCVRMLGEMEKHGSCAIIPDTDQCAVCELPFSTTRDQGGEEEIVHCCFRRAHTLCLEVAAAGYSRVDMTGTCGDGCSGQMTAEVSERIEMYADMCVVKRKEGEEGGKSLGGSVSRGGSVVEGERVNWADHLQNMEFDLVSLLFGGGERTEGVERSCG